MLKNFPRWVFVSVVTAVAVFAAAIGYQHDSVRLRAEQDRGLGQLSATLKGALASTLALQERSVRPLQASSGGDTLELAVARPVLLCPRARAGTEEWYLDPLCLERLRDPYSRESIHRLGLVPARIWALDRVHIYVDKVRGGLWQVTGDAQPRMLAPSIESFAIRTDDAETEHPGLLLELVGSWPVGPATAIKRRLYRYLPGTETAT